MKKQEENNIGVNKKLLEIFSKIENKNYTRFDQLQDFGEAIIEIYVKDSEEKINAKQMIASIRKVAEMLNNRNK